MIRITEICAGETVASAKQVPLAVDRFQLAKRRWRGVAQDEAVFGFDLEAPMKNGDCFYEDGNGTAYVIEQLPEAVLFVAYSENQSAARLGWMIGNLHFPADFAEDGLMVQDDLAVRQMLERNHIAFEEASRVFAPHSPAGHHHHHEHDNAHAHSH